MVISIKTSIDGHTERRRHRIPNAHVAMSILGDCPVFQYLSYIRHGILAG